MKKILFAILAGFVLATSVPSACGRKGPDAPPDTQPPTVASTTPGYGEQDVPINATITVTFNEELDPATVNAQTVFLAQSGSPVPGSVTCSGNNAVFTPDGNLRPDSVHTFTVDVGVKDIAGNALVAPYHCTFTTGTRSVENNEHTVTPAAGSNGTISPNSPQAVPHDGTVTFTVTPDGGYSAASVTGCGGSLSGNTYTTGPITADCTVTASFEGEPVVTHTITATAQANGRISPAGAVSVDAGASQSFTIIPDEGYKVEVVLVDGRESGAITSYKFKNVTTDHTINAAFKEGTFTISASAEKGGTVSCFPSTVTFGSNSLCEIKPNRHYSIDKVMVDGNSVGAVSSWEFKNISASHTIKAYFYD